MGNPAHLHRLPCQGESREGFVKAGAQIKKFTCHCERSVAISISAFVILNAVKDLAPPSFPTPFGNPAAG